MTPPPRQRSPHRQPSAADRHDRSQKAVGADGALGGRVRDTRERILDIALELFNRQGYDKTSLREIAERLGYTKAALYYHFERKEDILLELHMRLHALGREALGRLGSVGDGLDDPDAWVGLLDDLIDRALENRSLLLLHHRNENAFSQLHHSQRHRSDHSDIESQVRRLLADPVVPLGRRVRLLCAIGAMFAGLVGGDNLFGDVSQAQIAELVRAAVHDLMGAKDTAKCTGRSSPRSRLR